MRNPLRMRRGQCIGDLLSLLEGLLDGQLAFSEPGCERLALHEFHHQVIRAHIVDLANVWMVWSRNRTCFTLKTIAELLRRNLDGNFSVKPWIMRFPYPCRCPQGIGV